MTDKQLAKKLAALSRLADTINAQTKPAAKEAVSLRLDPEVLRHFRATGRGWQTRINDILKAVIS